MSRTKAVHQYMTMRIRCRNHRPIGRPLGIENTTMTLPINVIDEASYGYAFENIPHKKLAIVAGRYYDMRIARMGFENVEFVRMTAHHFVQFASDCVPHFDLQTEKL